MSPRDSDTGRGVRRRAALRSPAAAALALLLLGAAGSPCRAGEEDYRFLLPDVEAQPGAAIRYTIQGFHTRSAQGFSLAARYPAGALDIVEIHARDTILEALAVDFFESIVDPAGGFFTVGVLVDTLPPFDGGVIPAIGRPLAFLHLEIDVAPSARGIQEIRLEDGLSEPPIRNLFVVDNRAVPVSELTSGRIRLPGPAGTPLFLRGDANRDASVDLSDAVALLDYVFRGGPTPRCLDAADTNDDGRVDLSDAVYLLAYVFQGGPEPPPPGMGAGEDPTADALDCAEPLFVREP